jgi:hypothetical protein
MFEKNIRRLLQFLTITLSVVAFSFVGANSAHAFLIDKDNPNFLLDSFSSLSYNPNSSEPWDYWWITLEGADDQENFSRVENVPCAHRDETCVTAETEGNTDFARLTIRPSEYPGHFYLTEISEERDGYTYGQTHRWLPTLGHPVVMTARTRLSSAYHNDGTGATGTNGILLWNAPIDAVSGSEEFPVIQTQFALGFNWSTAETLFGTYAGLRANVVDSNIPVFSVLIDKDINDWITQTMVWSVDHTGTQSVRFFADGDLLGETDLSQPFPSLTIEVWNDNQIFRIVDGQLLVDFGDPVEDQHFDVDYVRVSQSH